MEYQGLEPIEAQLGAHPRLRDELVQRVESGFDVSSLVAAVEGLAEDAGPDEVWELYDALGRAPRRADWGYDEPETPEDIRASLPPLPDEAVPTVTSLEDRVHGGWLGRVAGCMLGKPVEGGKHWTRHHLRDYLTSMDAYPLQDYVPKPDDDVPGYMFRDNWVETTRGRVRGSARDDDIDYSVIGLQVLETYGRDYTALDVAAEWLSRLPVMQTWTAEIVAVSSIMLGVRPPLTGSWRNPYREWIGAQIRADIHGWTNPGNPRAAALQAIPDATLSHTTNGIYGEMWAAALVAAAFDAPSSRAVVAESLRHVPPGSRLAEAVRSMLQAYDDGLSWEEAVGRAEETLGHYHWVHTVNNAAALAAGILWGDGDFTTTIGLTVQAGLDTDSNGATAGSVCGVMVGAAGLPRHWVDPLEDRITSAVMGFDNAAISDLAARTVALAREAR
jgi:ADP-ribosylglycohydrolase